MVYHGPSTGCKTCRKRKIKCDEQIPSCRKCLLRGYTCPGVPSDGTRSSGNSSVRGSLKASTERGRSGSGSESSTQLLSPPFSSSDFDGDAEESMALGLSPSTCWRDVAVCSWLSFLASDPAQLDPWSMMVINQHSLATAAPSDSKYFKDAFDAVALKRLSREPRFRSLDYEAAVCYGRALNRFRPALSQPHTANSDLSLLSVRLLIIYGFFTKGPPGGSPPGGGPPGRSSSGGSPSGSGGAATGPPASASPPGPPAQSSKMLANAQPHLDGLLRMLLLRGPQQLVDPMSNRLFCSLRDRICLNYSFSCRSLPIKKSNPHFAWFYEEYGYSPAETLTNTALCIPDLRSEWVKLGDQADDPHVVLKAEALIRKAYQAITSLQKWLLTLPEEWQKPGVAVIEPARPLAMNDLSGEESAGDTPNESRANGMSPSGNGPTPSDPIGPSKVGNDPTKDDPSADQAGSSISNGSTGTTPAGNNTTGNGPPIDSPTGNCPPRNSSTNDDGQYDGLGYVYLDTTTALIMLRFRTYEILLLQLVTTCLKWIRDLRANDKKSQAEPDRRLEEEISAADSNLRVAVNTVCGILAVYRWRDGKVYELGVQIPAGGLQHVGYLIEPMLVSMSVESTTPRQKLFIRSKMREFFT